MDNFNKQIVTFLDLKGFSNTAIFLKTVTMLCIILVTINQLRDGIFERFKLISKLKIEEDNITPKKNDVKLV